MCQKANKIFILWDMCVISFKKSVIYCDLFSYNHSFIFFFLMRIPQSRIYLWACSHLVHTCTNIYTVI